MKPFLKSSALALVLALGASAAASAGPFTSGSMVVSASTNTTTDVASTTVFTLNPASFTVGNGTGDFLGLSLTQADASFDLGTPTSFDFTDAGVGSFAASSITPPTFDATNHALSFLVLGNYTTGTDFSPSATLTADEAFSLTQIGGPGTAISVSATFFSPEVLPPPPSSPEPVTISLFGAGLAALGVVRRRRK